MYEEHNRAALDALGSTGSVGFLHSRRTLAIDPTDAMRSAFDDQAHTGTIRKYDTKKNDPELVADHGTADRREFEDCLHGLTGYANFKISYTS